METSKLKCDMKGRGVCPLPLENLLDIVRKKWSLSLIITIGNFGKLHFNAIHSKIKYNHTNKITPKILSARLKELEKAGLVKRKTYEEPFMVKYSLTKKGKQLHKMFILLGNFYEKKN